VASSDKGSQRRSLRVLVSATEPSADRQTAQMISSLKKICDEQDFDLEVAGIAGPFLQEVGTRVIYDSSLLSSMGFVEVLGRAPRYLEARRRLLREARASNWDLALLSDASDFHLPIAAKLKKLGLPVVDFIPPKAWVWRKQRVRVLAKAFDLVLCILPFEEVWFKERGVCARFVGNPWIEKICTDNLRSERATSDELRKQLGLKEGELSLVWMPGSRPREIQENWTIGLEAIRGFLSTRRNCGEDWRVFLPASGPEATRDFEARLRELGESFPAQIEIREGESIQCLQIANIGLIKSGTATLEAGVLGCPHLIYYQVPKSTEFLVRRVFRHLGPVGLINICLKGPETKVYRVPELVGSDLKSSELQALLENLWIRPQDQMDQKDYFNGVRKAFGLEVEGSLKSQSAADRAAAAILELVIKRRKLKQQGLESRRHEISGVRPSRVGRSVGIELRNSLLSKVWCTVNQQARKWVKPQPLTDASSGADRSPKVISVGNLQAGGSGKTPWVRKVAGDLLNQGLRVCILSRGVGGAIEKGRQIATFGPREIEHLGLKELVNLAGDEAALLLTTLSGVVYGVGARRRRAFSAVCSAYGANWDAVILDDGLQQFSIKRDLDLVLVTTKTQKDIPYRESIENLKSGQSTIEVLLDQRVGSKLRNQIAVAGFSVSEVIWKTVYLGNVPSLSQRKRAALVAGVGNFLSLRTSLEEEGWDFHWLVKRRDHSYYETNELKRLLNRAKKEGLTVVTTSKDYVKWKALDLNGELLSFLDNKICVVDHEPHLIPNKAQEAPWLRLFS
jgi:lipid-A-disaccharide synthase